MIISAKLNWFLNGAETMISIPEIPEIEICGLICNHLSGSNQHLELQANHCSQWIGLRENLQETIDFPIKYGTFL